MMAVSLGTIVCYTVAGGALALAMGVFYPQFETENAAQIPTSFGGLLFMMASVSLLGVIIAIEAGPVASHLRSQQGGDRFRLTLDLALSLGLVVLLCAATTFVSLRLALRRLEALEV
jgi:ABC-2 type transport system permease protein